VTRNGAPVGTYNYDTYDQRIGKTTDTGTNRFVYGQNQNIALEFDGSGALTNRYLHGNSIDAIIADEANGSVGWTLTDNLGTVRDVVDGTGARQNHIVYDSFGNVTSETNSSFDTRFTFTGREFDAETGNYDYRSRFYRPGRGGFIEEDPIRYSAGDVNLYRYVGNSPVDSIDPFGYFKKGRGYFTQDEAIPSRFRVNDGVGSSRPIPNTGGSPTRPIPRTGGGSPQPTPRSFPVNIYGYPGVFDGLDTNLGKWRSNIDTDQLSEEQQNILSNPKSKAAQNFKHLKPDPNTCDDKGKKCFTGQVPTHLGGDYGGGYATYVTGSTGDFIIFPQNGKVAFFDGLIQSQGELHRKFNVSTKRHVAEVKIVTESVKVPFLRGINLAQFTVAAQDDLSIARACKYKYSFVVNDAAFAKDLQKNLGSLVKVYYIPL
jgi:RHS repeat-associated protein